MDPLDPLVNKLSENSRMVYILYLIGLVFGITAIIGVVIAYINKDDAMPDWLKTHYRYQLNTFWMGLVMLVAGVLLIVLIIGIFILLFWMIWIIIRCVKGMKLLDQQQPIPNPEGWGFN